MLIYHSQQHRDESEISIDIIIEKYLEKRSIAQLEDFSNVIWF